MTKLQDTLRKEHNFYRRFYEGFEYFIIRSGGEERVNLCGYVVIPKDSIYYINDDYNSYDISCHGSLTFSGELPALSVNFAIGFDCAHLYDIWSTRVCKYHDPHATYKTVNYVNTECKSIIDQLKNKVNND